MVDYRTYRLANCFTLSDGVVSGYISEMVLKVKSQMKAHFFDTSDRISIIGFFSTFKLACDTTRKHKGAKMWLSLLSKVLLRQRKQQHASRDAHWVRSLSDQHRRDDNRNEATSLSRRGSELPAKEVSNDQAIVEMDAAILQYTKPANMTLMPHAGDLFKKSWKVVDF